MSDECQFIYGGPFVPKADRKPFVDTLTPINLQLQPIFKRSFAYYTVRERLPVILTKVIDEMSREAGTIMREHSATDKEVKQCIASCSKLKSDIQTNKRIELLAGDTQNVKDWNEWIEQADKPFYFTAVWLFTECYLYRSLQNFLETSPNLKKYDPFKMQKHLAFTQNFEAMSLVANKMNSDFVRAEESPEAEKKKKKDDFVMLLKLALWANQCDLSLSAGAANDKVEDPLRTVETNQNKVLVDDSMKIATAVVDRAADVSKLIATNPNLALGSCECIRLAQENNIVIHEKVKEEKKVVEAKEGENADAEPSKPCSDQYRCSSKNIYPNFIYFDIICDNSGFELFTDLCLGHFLIERKIADKVRFHVKEIPWFVSDVTPQDFTWVIEQCAKVDFKKGLPQPESDDATAEAAPEEPYKSDGTSLDLDPGKFITSKQLQSLGAQFQQHVADNSFILVADTFWTTPHVFKDMKKYDPALYRFLQFSICTLFKGDLNYRKLLGEKNWNPVTTFDAALEGFNPSPVAAVRTVKADLICGLPKGKWEELQKIDEKWMSKGEYGVIQYCAKKEELKPSTLPCEKYGNECK